MEGIRQYWKRTDKFYLLLCIFSSTMAVVALASWATKQGNGFAVDELTGAITGIGDYRRAVVQGGAAVLGLCVALLLSCIDYRSLVKVWPVHVAVTWGLVLPTLFIRNVSIGPLTIGYNAGDTDLLVTWLYKLTMDKNDYSLAATIGILVFVICATVSLLTFNLSKSSRNEEEFS